MTFVEPAVNSIDDILALPDDGKRHELLDGVHVVTPPPTVRHQEALGILYQEVVHELHRPLGWKVFIGPAEVLLGPRTLVQPDLFVVRVPEGRPTPNVRDLQIPRLVVEMISPSTAARDRGSKRRLYQAVKIPDYWIVDLDARLIEHWQPHDTRPAIHHDGIELTVSEDRMISIDLREFFRQAISAG